MSDEAGAWGDPEWRRREIERLSERMNEPPETGPRFWTLAEQGRIMLALRQHERGTELHRQILRERAHWWGRCLLWLLRKTT